jgi:hypothetical protein
MHPGLRYAGDVDLLCRLYLGGFGVHEYHRVSVVKRQHSGTQTSRATRDGSDLLGWSFLMHQYMRFSSKADRTLEHLQKLRLVCRRTVQHVLVGEWGRVSVECRSVALMAQSYLALMLGLRWLIPRRLKLLLEHSNEV